MKTINFARYSLMLVRNIIFQGILYMSTGEKIYKLSITFILSIIFYYIFNNLTISILSAHLLNYIINGQFYVVYRYFDPNANMKEGDLLKYISFIERNIIIFKPLDVLIIGGVARGTVKSTSDLDIRIYHNNKMLDSIKAYVMATVFRFYGLVTRFPIDVFCFSNLKFLEKIRKDEIPVNFMNHKDIERKYPLSINYKFQLDKIKYDS